jgi:hypothetical protein
LAEGQRNAPAVSPDYSLTPIPFYGRFIGTF